MIYAQLGEFTLGANALGLPIPYVPFDAQVTMISQYANSPIIGYLVDCVTQWLAANGTVAQFPFDVQSLDQATPYGLDVLGRIIGLTRSGPTYTMDFAFFRTALKAKARANLWDGSITELNAILRSLFPDRGNCYVRNTGPLVIDYIFEFPTSALERQVVMTSGVLPQPAAVRVGYYNFRHSVTPAFGYDRTDAEIAGWNVGEWSDVYGGN